MADRSAGDFPGIGDEVKDVKEYKTIILGKKDGIGYITLNRPEVFNAISQEFKGRDFPQRVLGDRKSRPPEEGRRHERQIDELC